MTAPLVVTGLGKRYLGAPSPALDRVDLQVAAGTILVLLGRSGAGKTTLLRVLAGLEDADEGRIVLGERVLADPRSRVPPEKRGIGLVFQHLELWSHMTVAENIAFGLEGRPRGRAAAGHAVVREVAAQVGVESMLLRKPPTLSGGERQRVAIARTLAPDPNVILYDEPLANLDPERRQDLRRLIRTLCRSRGTTLLYVTHDAEDAMSMGDEIAVLARGRIEEQGPPASLYARPRTLAGARALGAVNVLPATVHGRVARTRLGDLALSVETEEGEGLALVRPEGVLAGGGVEARVDEVRPRGSGWSFEATLDGLRLEGWSAEPLETGCLVGLRVEGPVTVVPVKEAP